MRVIQTLINDINTDSNNRHMKLKHTLDLYFKVVRWNGESATDLLDQIRMNLQEVPALWEGLIRRVLHRFQGPRSMRFDFSEVREPILAIDRNGYAIIGNVRAMRVTKLAALLEPAPIYATTPRYLKVSKSSPSSSSNEQRARKA